MTIKRVLLVVSLAAAVAGCESIYFGASDRVDSSCLKLPPCAELLGPPEASTPAPLDPTLEKYAIRMLRKIRRFWYIPLDGRMGGKGRVKVRFGIQAGGTLACFDLLGSSGTPALSQMATRAVCRAAPYQELPEGSVGSRPEGVTLTFYYNEEPAKGPKVLFTGPDGVTYGVQTFGGGTPQPSPTPTPAIPNPRQGPDDG